MKPSRVEEIAVVDNPPRRAFLALERLDQPPVLLEGAALEIYDRIDGVLDAEGIARALAEVHPDVPDLARQVLDCLEELERVGLVVRQP